MIPSLVAQDIEQGFVVTDQDDGWQRYKKTPAGHFLFKANYGTQEIEEVIDLAEVDQEEAISGYYGSLKEVHDMYGEDADLIIAECAFEQSAHQAAFSASF